MSYQPYVVPVRSQMYDASGRLTLQWQSHFADVARKAGRSLVWRGEYDKANGSYSVNDVVSTGKGEGADYIPLALWVAQQANPVNGTAVEPGSEEAKKPADRVWALIIEPKATNGLPPGGTEGQILAKNSDADYDAKWEDAPTGGGGGGGTGTVTHTGGSLTADLPVFGAGGADVKVGTKSGNTDEVATVSGSLTAGHFVTADGSGNLVDGGAPVTLPIAESDVTGLVSDLAAKAPLASPTFTGDPKAPTPTAGDNDTSIATTAFVQDAVSTGISGITYPVTSVAGKTGAVTLVEGDIASLTTDLAAKAPLASPALTGTPTAPTAAPGTNTTQIATTAFVEGEIGPGGSGAYFAWGGDGSDGAVTFDGAATILGMAPSGGVYTLTRDICCTDIAVNSGVTLKTANYAIFATGTVTVDGTIQNDGTAGLNGATPVSSAGGNGGTQGSRAGGSGDGHYPRLISPVAGGAGGAGGTTTGTQAGAATAGNSVTTTPVDNNGVAGATGSSGGKGGTGTSGAGGAARTGAAGGAAFGAATNWQTGRHPQVALYGVAYSNLTTTASAKVVWASNGCNGGAAGGSGGGGDGANAGGGGGGGGGEGGCGGILAIFAHTIVVSNTGSIHSNGGNGGNGGNGRTQTTGNVGGGGGGGGGAGGVGGIVWLIYHRYTNAGTVTANGGNKGLGGTKGSPHGTGTDDAANGADGSNGPAGNVITIPC